MDPVASNESLVHTHQPDNAGLLLKVKLNSKPRNVRQKGNFLSVHNLTVLGVITVRIYPTNCHK